MCPPGLTLSALDKTKSNAGNQHPFVSSYSLIPFTMKLSISFIALILAAFSSSLASAARGLEVEEKNGSLETSSASLPMSLLDPSSALRKKKKKSDNKKKKKKDGIEAFITVDNEHLNPKKGGHSETVNGALYKAWTIVFDLDELSYSPGDNKVEGWYFHEKGDKLADDSAQQEIEDSEELGWGHQSFGTWGDGIWKIFIDPTRCNWCLDSAREGSDDSSPSPIAKLMSHESVKEELEKELCKQLVKSGDRAFRKAKNCKIMFIAKPGQGHDFFALE